MARLQHKRGRKTKYICLLQNPYHQSVRAKALLRDGFSCTKCKRRDLPLELHHIKYWVNGINIVGKELDYMDYVIILCEECHQKEHKL